MQRLVRKKERKERREGGREEFANTVVMRWFREINAESALKEYERKLLFSSKFLGFNYSCHTI